MSAVASILYDTACSYIEQSPQWPLFPVHPKNKLPLISTGRDHAENASTDPAVIRAWIEREFPGCGIGMPTGKASGTVVLDADRKHDGEERLAELETVLGPLPRERMVRTQSGGLHVYCAHPGEVRVRTGAGVSSPLGRLLGGRAGVDVRADGGIVVLPPSAGYKWIADDDTLPPLPKLWLLAIQGAGDEPPKPRVQTANLQVDRRWSPPDRLDTIPDGDRNASLYRRGVALRIAGATDSEILDDLEWLNVNRCSPSLSARDVTKIAASAARADGGHS